MMPKYVKLQIMDRELENIKAPAPRPMRAHTFDFNLSFCGACLLDGECKGSQAEHEKSHTGFPFP